MENECRCGQAASIASEAHQRREDHQIHRIPTLLSELSCRRTRWPIRIFLKLSPPHLVLGLCHLFRFSRGYGRNQTTIEATTKQNTVWNLRHKPFSYCFFQGLADRCQVGGCGRNGGIWALGIAVPPGRLVVTCCGIIFAVVYVTGREGNDAIALINQRLQFRREVNRAWSL